MNKTISLKIVLAIIPLTIILTIFTLGVINKNNTQNLSTYIMIIEGEMTQENIKKCQEDPYCNDVMTVDYVNEMGGIKTREEMGIKDTPFKPGDCINIAMPDNTGHACCLDNDSKWDCSSDCGGPNGVKKAKDAIKENEKTEFDPDKFLKK